MHLVSPELFCRSDKPVLHRLVPVDFVSSDLPPAARGDGYRNTEAGVKDHTCACFKPGRFEIWPGAASCYGDR